MRALLLAIGLLAATPALAQAPSRAADEAAVRQLVRDYVNARALGGEQAVGDLFTQDADQHTTAGEWRRGRAGVMAGTTASSARNPGARDIAVETVRFLSGDVAIVDGPYQITQAGAPVRRMWATLVLKRDGGRWRIAAIRNATPTAAAPN